MSYRLPSLILFSVLCSLFTLSIVEGFSVISPVSAQEITIAISPAPTEVQQFSPAAKSLADFIKDLVFGLKKNKINQLGDANKGMLPPIEFTTLENQETVKLQANADLEGVKPTSAAMPIYKAAQDYTVGSALRGPYQEEKSLSTNLVEFFTGFINKNIIDVLTIAIFGDQKAQDLVKSYFPPTLNIDADSGETMMERGLPYLRCSGAPADLCQNNKLNFAGEEQ